MSNSNALNLTPTQPSSTPPHPADSNLLAAQAEALRILLRIARGDDITQARLAATAILRLRPPPPTPDTGTALARPSARTPATQQRETTSDAPAAATDSQPHRPHPTRTQHPSPRKPTPPPGIPALLSQAAKLLTRAGAPIPGS